MAKMPTKGVPVMGVMNLGLDLLKKATGVPKTRILSRICSWHVLQQLDTPLMAHTNLAMMASWESLCEEASLIGDLMLTPQERGEFLQDSISMWGKRRPHWPKDLHIKMPNELKIAMIAIAPSEERIASMTAREVGLLPCFPEVLMALRTHLSISSFVDDALRHFFSYLFGNAKIGLTTQGFSAV